MAIPTLDEMEERAQRHLDGMTINRDSMARDVLLLVKAVRSAQTRAKEIEATNKKTNSGSYSGAFSGIFDEIFGRRSG